MKAALYLLQKLKFQLLRIWLLTLILFSPGQAFDFDENFFPVPQSLVPQVRFWLSVYTLYSTNHIIIHDSEDLSIIYEVIDLNEAFPDSQISEKVKWDYADSVKEHYSQILLNLAAQDSLNPDTLAARNRYVFNLFHPHTSSDRFLRAAKNIRGQQGLRDQFRQGLIRSGRYRDHIMRVFSEYNLPLELAALPFVESMFHEKSYSKVGAAGIWQFTRRTGRRFLKINYSIDERFDPIKSTVAAAKLLKENYETLGSWPLAITAYNHGVHGMEKAVRTVGSTDIARIIEEYQSRSFKFASKNFYAEFLAALEVSSNYQIYFGKIDFEPEIQFVEYRLPRSQYLKYVINMLNLSMDTVKNFNPALRKSVLQSRRKIPRGYKLKIPFRSDGNYGVAMKYIIGHDKLAAQLVQKLDSNDRFAYQKQTKKELNGQKKMNPASPALFSSDAKLTTSAENQNIGWAIVRPGETLGHFADWLKISTSELRRINGLYFGEPIRVNQKIKLIFKNVSQHEFEQKRLAYNQSLEEEFFARFDISGLKIHHVKSGENIWNLCQNKYNVPYWLVKKYNPDIDLQQLSIGQTLIIPILEPREASSQ